jgi:hypothetical protein
VYFLIIIQRRALPIVWDSSVIWKVAVDKSGAAPLNCGGKRDQVRHGPHCEFAGIHPSLTILIFFVARSAIWPARDFRS